MASTRSSTSQAIRNCRRWHRDLCSATEREPTSAEWTILRHPDRTKSTTPSRRRRQQSRFASEGQSRSSRLLAEPSPVCKRELCRFANNAVVMSLAPGSDEQRASRRQGRDYRSAAMMREPASGCASREMRFRRAAGTGRAERHRSGGRSGLRPAAKAIVAGLGQAGPGLPERVGQCGQHLAERGVDFDVGERVAARRAPVDDRHWYPRLPGPVHEPQA